MQFSLGPVLFFWTKEDIRHFYEQAVSSSADIIYSG